MTEGEPLREKGGGRNREDGGKRLKKVGRMTQMGGERVGL